MQSEIKLLWEERWVMHARMKEMMGWDPFYIVLLPIFDYNVFLLVPNECMPLPVNTNLEMVCVEICVDFRNGTCTKSFTLWTRLNHSCHWLTSSLLNQTYTYLLENTRNYKLGSQALLMSYRSRTKRDGWIIHELLSCVHDT